jgi:hypothetical protein
MSAPTFRKGINVTPPFLLNGVEVNVTGQEFNALRAVALAGKNVYFVDANTGNNSNSGESWGQAFLTMAAAFAVIGSGDTIFFRGKIREQLTTPAQVFDVTVVGGGNRPRHADATPGGGELAANTWTVPAADPATAPLVKVLQQGWRFVNILFAGPTDAACVQLYRDGGAGDAERDASHAEFHGCRFASGQDGIEGVGMPYNVGIFDCSFHDLTGYALKQGGVAIAAPHRWQIKRNRFQACANWMGAWTADGFEIEENTIAEITTNRLDTSGGAGHNIVVNNYFDIAAADMGASGHVAGHATDVWSNYLLDTIETGVPA